MELRCPYCEQEIEDSDGDWNDTSANYEVDCPHCEKAFTMSIDYDKLYYPEKAPCLNGEIMHEWKATKEHPGEYFSTRQRCGICYRTRDLREITAA